MFDLQDIKIPYNKPFLSGNELEYIQLAIESGKISGGGKFTNKCQSFFEKKYGFHKCLLTSSCSDALEMAAILLNIDHGDEVIIPSYTFVSTANAFVLRGAKIVFADSKNDHPNLDEERLEELITEKTKAIVLVHYAGMACEMDEIMALAKKHNLFVVEDAAHCIDAFYQDRPLGSIGHLATFSFHETKNLIAGEGGMLVINDEQFADRAEIIWEKGTNRSAFRKGLVDKYNWVDVGSSFLPSEITAAFLWAQIENLERIQKKRVEIWKKYYQELKSIEKQGYFIIQEVPDNATINGHIFYIICKSLEWRNFLIEHFRSKKILAVFHYLPLHNAPYFKEMKTDYPLPMSEFYSDRLLRLPLFFELTAEEQQEVIDIIKEVCLK